MVQKNDNLMDIQKKVDRWIKKHGGYWPPLALLGAVIEELGEVAREINNLEGFKPKKNKKKDILLKEELADLIFSIICLANHYNIDLNSGLNEVMLKYTKRDAKRFI